MILPAAVLSIFCGMGGSESLMYFIAVACAGNIGMDRLFMGAMRFERAECRRGQAGTGRADAAALRRRSAAPRHWIDPTRKRAVCGYAFFFAKESGPLHFSARAGTMESVTGAREASAPFPARGKFKNDREVLF